MNLTAISPEERERLQELLQRSGLKTQVDLVNEALTIYEYLLSNIERGGSLPFQDMGDVIKEIAIGSFLDVQRRVQKAKAVGDGQREKAKKVKQHNAAQPISKTAKQALG